MPRIKSLQFRLAWLFVAITIVAICFAAGNLRLNYLAWTMNNDDVISDGGVDLVIKGPAKRIVEEYGLAGRAVLKSTLDDPQRFAAAHVALVELTGVKTGSTWHSGAGEFVFNKLTYHRDTNNGVAFKLDDNPELESWWVETVGQNTGMPFIDEDSDTVFWPD